MELQLLPSTDSAARALKPRIDEHAPQVVRQVTDEQVWEWRGEMDDAYARMEAFDSSDLEDVLVTLAAVTARFSEIRTKLIRYPSHLATKFRTQELDKLLEECDRQFKVYSRILTCRSQEWEISKGGV